MEMWASSDNVDQLSNVGYLRAASYSKFVPSIRPLRRKYKCLSILYGTRQFQARIDRFLVLVQGPLNAK